MKRILIGVPSLLLLAVASVPASAQPFDDPRFDRIPDLNGTWYMNGNGDLPCSIRERPDGRALFTNEKGSEARGEVRGYRVYIPDWSPGDDIQGLEGRIRGDQIVWPNGSYWSRDPGDRPFRYRRR
jgi:hypothetical protein